MSYLSPSSWIHDIPLGDVYPTMGVAQGESLMANGYGPNDLQGLPPGSFSGHNIPVQTMPWVVASALSGSTFFKEERIARAYAARLISRGVELEVVLFQLVPVATFSSKSDLTLVDVAELRPSLPPPASDNDGGGS